LAHASGKSALLFGSSACTLTILRAIPREFLVIACLSSLKSLIPCPSAVVSGMRDRAVGLASLVRRREWLTIGPFVPAAYPVASRTGFEAPRRMSASCVARLTFLPIRRCFRGYFIFHSSSSKIQLRLRLRPMMPSPALYPSLSVRPDLPHHRAAVQCSHTGEAVDTVCGGLYPALLKS